MEQLKTGLTGIAATTVVQNNTAQSMKSGMLPVFATPAMTALMEEAACNAVNNYLEDGMGTVGISLNITHDAPSAIGAHITAMAKLTAIDGRKLSFTVTATDGDKLIGKGTHQRFIINNAKFLSKLQK